MIGERIHRLRLERGLTLEDVAKGINSTKQQVHRIESGQFPSSKTIIKLATFFSVSADFILGLVEEPHGHLKPADLTPDELLFVQAIRGKSFQVVLEKIAALMGQNANSGTA